VAGRPTLLPARDEAAIDAAVAIEEVGQPVLLAS
jgi:hypothetical protein